MQNNDAKSKVGERVIVYCLLIKSERSYQLVFKFSTVKFIHSYPFSRSQFVNFYVSLD